MEYINKVEIAGRVGTIKVSDVNGTKVANITVATNQTFTAQDGEVMVNTTWHYVVAWESIENDLSFIQAGSQVHVWGRLRTRKYTNASGETKYATEILSDKIELMQ